MSEAVDPKEGLAALLADVLSEGAPDPELLVRYADDPSALSPEERQEIERLLAESPQVGDQLKILKRFDFSAAREGSTRQTGSWLTDALARVRRLFESRPLLSWAPAIAVAALVLLLLYPGPSFLASPNRSSEPEGTVVLAVAMPEYRAPLGATPRLRSADEEISAGLAFRALAIREKVLGPEHPELVRSLNDLAGLYLAQGDYARAEPLYARALGIREKALGPEHPEVARSLQNLAFLYQAKGDYARAEPLLTRARAIRKKSGAIPAYRIAPWRPAAPPRGQRDQLHERWGTSLPDIIALAPEHVGQTASQAPSLYWYLSEIPEAGGFEFWIGSVDADSVPGQPSGASAGEVSSTWIRKDLPSPARPGLQRILLSDYGVELEAGVEYSWTVPSGLDAFASVWIKRVELPASAAKRLTEASLGEAPAIYAEAGLWYDALSSLLELVPDHPNNESLRTARLKLLRQGGLEAVDEALAKHEH